MKNYPKIRIEEFDKIIKLVDDEFIKGVEEYDKERLSQTKYILDIDSTYVAIEKYLKSKKIKVDKQYIPVLEKLYMNRHIMTNRPTPIGYTDPFDSITKESLMEIIEEYKLDKDLVISHLKGYNNYENFNYIYIINNLIEQKIYEKLKIKPHSITQCMHKLGEVAREIPNTEISEDVLLNSFMNDFNYLLERYKISGVGDKVFDILEEIISINYNLSKNLD